MWFLRCYTFGDVNVGIVCTDVVVCLEEHSALRNVATGMTSIDMIVTHNYYTYSI